MGLGTLWCDIALYVATTVPEVAAMLQIPDGYKLNYILLLGAPKVKYLRTVQKDAANVTVL